MRRLENEGQNSVNKDWGVKDRACRTMYEEWKQNVESGEWRGDQGKKKHDLWRIKSVERNV